MTSRVITGAVWWSGVSFSAQNAQQACHLVNSYGTIVGDGTLIGWNWDDDCLYYYALTTSIVSFQFLLPWYYIPFCAAAYTHKTSSIYVYEPQPYHIQVLWVNSHFLDKNCINNILSTTHSFTAQQHISISKFSDFLKIKQNKFGPSGSDQPD